MIMIIDVVYTCDSGPSFKNETKCFLNLIKISWWKNKFLVSESHFIQSFIYFYLTTERDKAWLNIQQISKMIKLNIQKFS